MVQQIDLNEAIRIWTEYLVCRLDSEIADYEKIAERGQATKAYCVAQVKYLSHARGFLRHALETTIKAGKAAGIVSTIWMDSTVKGHINVE